MTRAIAPLTPRWGAALVDPPWMEAGAGAIKRGADRRYDLIRTADVPGVVLRSGLWRPAADAHLYLWATNNHLPDALWVMRELGFRYVTKVTWVKEEREPYLRCVRCFRVWKPDDDDDDRPCDCSHPLFRSRAASTQAIWIMMQRRKFGLGQYFRGADECILFGVRGRGLLRRTPNRSLTTLLYGRLREHSRKPEEAYALVEARSVGPFVDLFSSSEKLLGEARPGWTHWGQPRGAPHPITNVASSLRNEDHVHAAARV